MESNVVLCIRFPGYRTDMITKPAAPFIWVSKPTRDGAIMMIEEASVSIAHSLSKMCG